MSFTRHGKITETELICIRSLVQKVLYMINLIVLQLIDKQPVFFCAQGGICPHSCGKWSPRPVNRDLDRT